MSTDQLNQVSTQVSVRERRAWAIDGFVALFASLALFLFGGYQFVQTANRAQEPTLGDLGLPIFAILLAVLLATPLVVIQPGESRVVQFFGRYIGTTRRTGLTWVLPLTTRRKVSIRVNNFETQFLKVNDAEGNPVEIGAIVVWQIADTAKAIFAVSDAVGFVRTQSEAALRHVAGTHPYDDPGGEGTSLRGSTDQVSSQLSQEVAERVSIAGLQILEVRISHLAYSTEIAQAMLQRQQASAIVAARATIVDGAVGMVEMALDRLADKGIVELDEERKAQMVSNLLVVLCGDSRATPVVNTGTLY